MDIEFYQYEDQVFHPNLICWSNAEEEEIYHAENVEDYLEPFEELMMVEDDERERKVVSFSYNLRGIDGNFIQQELYDQGTVVEKALFNSESFLANALSTVSLRATNSISVIDKIQDSSKLIYFIHIFILAPDHHGDQLLPGSQSHTVHCLFVLGF